MRKYIPFLIAVVSFLTVNAQLQNPSSIKWRQIKTSNFTVVFPSEIENRGIETAQILETAYKPTRNSLRTATPKTTVFLYNQSSISNGYTALAPYMLAFYTTPPQDALLVGGTDWLQTLAVHEYRHAVQYAKLNNNFTYFMGGLFGELGHGLFMNLSVPVWVFEGDAVCTETAFSLEGRGRLPIFTRDIRALELEDIRYSYNKAYLRSYKDYFPNHYHLGYVMSSYIRSTYGDQTWNNILTRTTRFSYWPWTFSRSLKKYTRFSMNKTYNMALDEYKNQWEEKISGLKVTPTEEVFLPKKKSYTNYSYPSFTEDNNIVAVKSGFDDVTELVFISDGKEKVLTEINPVDRVHSNGKQVVWSIETASIRWGERSYSNILIYDLKTKKKQIVTFKGKYYGPAVSPDGERIAAVRYDKLTNCKLVILNSKTGKIEQSFDFKDNEFIRMPSWSQDGNKIVFTISKEQKRNISVFYLKSGVINEIVGYTTESITNPVFFKDYILFNSPVTGIDAIYAINPASNERFNVVVDRYGAYNPSVSSDGSKMVLQNYTSQGSSLSLINSDPEKWNKFDGNKNYGDDFYQRLVKLENGISIFDSLKSDTSIDYKIKKYHPLLHSLNIHSWAPLTVANGVGLGVFSNDKLNTTSILAGVNYFPEATAHREFLNLTYSRYFPVFEVMASYGRVYNVENDSAGDPDYRPYDEKLFRGGILLPLNFSRSIHTTQLELNLAYNYIYYNMESNAGFEDPRPAKDEVTALEYGLKFMHYRQLSIRDINPKFGQVLTLKYWKTPFDVGTDGERLVGQGILYLPGIVKHHSLTLKGAYEKNSSSFKNGIYSLTTGAEFTRGYAYKHSDLFWKGALEYTLPVAYPDLSLGPVIYFKRIWANMFYDYGKRDWEGSSQVYSSLGLDLNFTLHLFNIMQIPWEFGVRSSYLIEEDRVALEFLLFSTAL